MLDKNQINAKIREKEKAIDNFEYDIKQLKKKLNELSDLLSRLVKFRKNVTDAHSSRINRLGAVQNWTVNSKITGPYSDGMRSLVKGSKYTNALDGLEEAKRKINQKSEAIEEEIESLRRKIRNCESDIRELKAKLLKC